MSNLIKVYTIKYDDSEKKLIDLNEKADMFQKIYFDKFKEKQREKDDFQHGEESSLDENGDPIFVEGLAAISVERNCDVEESNKITLEELEEIRREEEQKIKEEADKIISDAKEEASRILATAQVEASKLKTDTVDQAKKDGYIEGIQKAEVEIAQKKADLEQEQQRLDQEYKNLVKSLEPEFVELMISFVKKLTGYAVEEKRDIILYLVEQALSGIENSNSYIIRVSSDDYEIVNKKKKDILVSLKEGVEIEIVEDKLLSKAQCLIETDSRVIDCSLDVQLRNLIGDLRLLSGIIPDISLL